MVGAKNKEKKQIKRFVKTSKNISSRKRIFQKKCFLISNLCIFAYRFLFQLTAICFTRPKALLTAGTERITSVMAASIPK